MYKILLAAGGTGGHIFPAIAFGKWIRETHGDAAVSFVCGSRELEQKIYRAEGIEPIVLSCSGSPLSGSASIRARRCAELFRSFMEARRAIGRIRPDVCVTFGGYSSVPMIAAALIARTRIVTHEQNARAGMATRAAMRMHIPIATGWETCEPFKKGTYVTTGIPVRRFRLMSRQDALRELGLCDIPSDARIALVMTGSLGSGCVARVIDEISRREDMKEWIFISTRSDTDEPRAASHGHHHLPMQWDPSALFSIADVAVVRAGASTLAEMMALEIPSVSVPWSGSAGGHQQKNAESFCDGMRRLVWSEEMGDEDDLASKISYLYKNFSIKSSTQREKMYNNGEGACSRLWDMAARP